MATIGILGILIATLAVPQSNGVQRAVLHGFALGEDSITITVSSCGCTEADDFSFLVEREPGRVRRLTVQRLTVLRLEPDHCEMTATEVQFEYPLADANLEGGRPVTVLNRYRALEFGSGCR